MNNYSLFYMIQVKKGVQLVRIILLHLQNSDVMNKNHRIFSIKEKKFAIILPLKEIKRIG